VTDLLIPGLTLVCGLAGGFAGARGAIVRLETQMADVLKRMDVLGKRVHRHNDDIIIHDAEMDTVMAKLDLRRLPRQKILND